MKKLSKFNILLIVFFFSYFTLQAQSLSFQQLKNLYGGNILSLENVDTTALYAGTSTGIYHSSNQGKTWEKELDGLAAYKISAYSKEMVYAGTSKGLYLRSAGHWNKIQGFTDHSVKHMDILSSGTLFADVQYKGLFKGSVSDNIFTRVTTLGYSSSEYLITCSGNVVFVDKNMSLDEGKTWEEMENGWPEYTPLTVLAVDMSDSLIIAGSSYGVFRYNLESKTWNDLSLYQHCFDLDLYAHTTVFLSSAGGVYRYSLKQKKWQQVNMGLSSAYVKAIRVAGNNVFAGTNYGVDAMPVDGIQWYPSDTGMLDVPVYAILSSKNRLLVSSSKGLIYTDDDGESWHTTRRMDYGSEFHAGVHRFVKTNAGTLYAATSSGLFFSHNNGISWLNYGGTTGQQVNDVLFDKNGHLLKAADDGVFKSSDGGMIWSKLNENQNIGKVTCIVVDKDDNIYAGTYAGIYALAKNETQWQDISDDSIKNIYFNRLIYSGNRLYAATSKGVYKYDLLYKNWSVQLTGMPSQWVNNMIQNDDGKFYAATHSGIYVSDDSTAVWNAMDMGEANTLVNCITFDSVGNMYYGTAANGVFTSKQSLTSIQNTKRYNETFGLHNFPNPFANSTTINYTIPINFKNAEVTLTVFDMLGKKVSILVKATQNPGTYSAVFSGGGLKQGIYFYRLKVNKYTTLRKMVITE